VELRSAHSGHSENYDDAENDPFKNLNHGSSTRLGSMFKINYRRNPTGYLYRCTFIVNVENMHKRITQRYILALIFPWPRDLDREASRISGEIK
jgi:hypothetical protein